MPSAKASQNSPYTKTLAVTTKNESEQACRLSPALTYKEDSGMFETTIVGNVGSVKFVNAGGKMPVLNVSLASSRRVGENQYTDWTSVKIWGERAEKLQAHVTKGMKLLVRGRPEAKGFKRDDGTVAGELVLHVTELEFLSPKKSGVNGEEEHSESESDPVLAEAGAGRTQRRRG